LLCHSSPSTKVMPLLYVRSRAVATGTVKTLARCIAYTRWSTWSYAGNRHHSAVPWSYLGSKLASPNKSAPIYSNCSLASVILCRPFCEAFRTGDQMNDSHFLVELQGKKTKGVDVGFSKSLEIERPYGSKRTYLECVTEEGDWIEDRPDEHSKKTSPDGRVIEGNFRHGSPWNARGVWKHPDGTVSEGQWADGKLTGYCKVTYPDGRTSNGMFWDGVLRAGRGVIPYPNGVVEEGRWEDGNLTGKRSHPDGKVEEGQWVEGKLTGHCRIKYPDGRTLEGEARAGELYNGRGTLQAVDWVVAEGRWVNGTLTGKRTYLDGTVEEGQWAGGKPTGLYKKTYPDGRKFEGEYRKGVVYSGQGTMEYLDGMVEEGVWRLRNLTGKRLYTDGAVEEGQWVKGKATGPYKKTYPDGRSFEGEFREGKTYNGHGTVKYPNGVVEEGTWVNGNLTGKRTYPEGRLRKASGCRGS
jgi:hypothetical protein